MKYVAPVLIALVVYFVSDCNASGYARCPFRQIYLNETGVRVSSTANYPYPGTKVLNTQCNWRFQALTKGHVVVFDILQLNLTKTNNCSSTNLIIYDGIYSFHPRLSVICATSERPQPIVSSSKYMYMTFTIRGGERGQGYLAHVYEIQNKTTPTQTPYTIPTTTTTTTTVKPETTTTAQETSKSDDSTSSDDGTSSEGTSSSTGTKTSTTTTTTTTTTDSGSGSTTTTTVTKTGSGVSPTCKK